MTLDEFRETLREATPPAGLSRSLEALWRIANDEWDAAHQLVQSGPGSDGAWIHAHLHRIEGDLPQCGVLVPPRRQARLLRAAGRGVGGHCQGPAAVRRLSGKDGTAARGRRCRREKPPEIPLGAGREGIAPLS